MDSGQRRGAAFPKAPQCSLCGDQDGTIGSCGDGFICPPCLERWRTGCDWTSVTDNCTITLPAAACNLTPSTAGAKTLTAAYVGDTNFNFSTSPEVGHTVGTGPLDVDASVSATKYDALTDGLLVVRYLSGLEAAALANGALGATATRTSPAAIKTYLDGIRPALDIDGDGATKPLTDGLLIVRYLMGVRGDALIAGALDPAATRTTAPAIEAYLQTLLP